jgi:nucleoid-associated protein YgaU
MAPEKEIEEPKKEEVKKARSSRLRRAREAAKKQHAPSPEDVKAAIEKARQSAAFIAEHTVKPGDTLGHISKKYYGSAYHYPLIYEANKEVIGDDPDLIIDGTVLKIPKLPEDKK